jgi:hypothetical protein
MPTQLKNLRIDEVSSVDRGANEHAQIMLMKREYPDFGAELDAALEEVRKWGEDEDVAVTVEKIEDVAVERVQFQKSESNTMDISSQTILAIAKNSVNGATNPHPRSVYHAEITKRAEAIRKAGESPQQAYARFVKDDPDGRTLIRAHFLAKSDVPVAAIDKPQMDPHAAEAKHCPSYGILQQHAKDLQAANPKLSDQQAFSQVYSDKRHRGLVANYMAERRAG